MCKLSARVISLMCGCAAVLLLGVGSGEADIHPVSPGESIQAAIDAADPGDEVVVGVGVYVERIDFKGKPITVRSTDPGNPAVVAATIIDGDAGGSVVTFTSGEGSGSLLAGLTIANGSGTDDGWGDTEGGGIYCQASSPTISGNTISGNSATYEGGGISCQASSPTISGNTISGNSADCDGGGIACWGGSPTISGNTISGNSADFGGGICYYESSPTISGNTISGNSVAWNGGGIACWGGSPTISGNTISGNSAFHGGGICCYESSPTIVNSIIAFSGGGGGIYADSGTLPTVVYCDVYGNTGGDYVNMADPTGTNGNISVDPLFANAGGGDFHLKSGGGRWDPIAATWVTDSVHSPCIDTGDPASPYANEPAPNGGRVNIGAYGNTPEASKAGPPRDIVWVDDDWTGEGNCGGHVWQYNAFDVIQDGVDVVNEGGTVEVHEGTYTENIDFKGKAITVRSTDPSDPAVVAATTIDGGAAGSVVTFASGEGSDSVIAGFTVTNGSGTEDGGSTDGGGIYCASASPTISRNTISGNTATDDGGGIYCASGSPTISGNTISGNDAQAGAGDGLYVAGGDPVIEGNVIVDNGNPAAPGTSAGGGMYLGHGSPVVRHNVITGNAAGYGVGITLSGSGGTVSATVANNVIADNTANGPYGGLLSYLGTVTIENNTISGNSARASSTSVGLDQGTVTLRNNIVSFSTAGGGVSWTGGTSMTVVYNNVYGNVGGEYVGVPDPTGTDGNISEDPLFANAGGGDFHLQSRGGRCLPGSGGVVFDAVDSPCLDAGNPLSDYSHEPAPNGDCVNMGAYGNTLEASRSWVGPSAPTLVEITPGSPTTTDDLTANASGATHPQDEPLTYVYEWSRSSDAGETWSEWGNGTEEEASEVGSSDTLDHRLTAKDEMWKARSRAYDGVLHGPWTESAPVTIGNSPPTLAWVGMPGFLADGHDPGAGAPDTTEFAFRVKITDPDDTAPAEMTVEVQRVEDCRTWVTITTLPLSPLFGTWATGMMCGATTTLPNGAYRYCFYAEDAEGAAATGDPATWSQGPKLIGPPQLWCTGLPGREGDYLDPETGIAGETRFKFSVQCTDGEGTAPVPRRLEIQRKRADDTWRGVCNVVMAAWGGGLRGGKYYNLSRKLPAGEYRYRFVFADDDGPATGSDSAGPDATQWRLGPVVTAALSALDRTAGGADALLTSLGALPCANGAQIVFSLSAPMAVDGRILNIAGRTVCTLCNAKECDAGANTLLWNARSDSGLRVPDGTYLIEVTAKAEDGGQTRTLAQVRLSR
jgi:parallel beta-helix repeat protein